MREVNRLAQNQVDYTALHSRHEVVLRVELLRKWLDVMGAKREAHVAEIGLGSGDVTKYLAGRFDRLTCVDLVQDVLTQVRRHIAPGQAEFICAAAEDVRFVGQFDRMFLIGLLEHLPDPVAALVNLRAALKPGGKVHVLVNNANSLHRHLGMQMGLIRELTEVSERDREQGHYRVYTPEGLIADLHGADFRLDGVDLHYLKPLPSAMMDALPIKISRAFVEVGRKFHSLSAYIYAEASVP